MILEAEQIHTYYGTSHILFGISFEVREGESICLLGRNGAGKTTTLKSIIGLTPPKAAQLGIGFVPDDRRIFPDLTVRQNILVARREKEGAVWHLDSIYGLFPKLQQLDTHMGTQLSGGEQQMLTIARTLMTNPDLLLLDEPGEGLAPLVIRTMEVQLGEIKKTGLNMLI
jgi:branched-chain amino acid transport system ATP-binding protein